MTDDEVVEYISEYCVGAHLSYNRERPTKVSPGVWKFYAVEMNHACRREGHCRERVYHACLLGKTLHIC